MDFIAVKHQVAGRSAKSGPIAEPRLSTCRICLIDNAVSHFSRLNR
jgi:hypothetical protein